MELPGLRYVLDRLRELVAAKRDNADDTSPDKRAGDEDREYAINSFRRALNETEIFYGTGRTLKKRNRAKEEELSRMWIEVAHELEPIDRELAKRCELKGRYWADPIGWPSEKLMELRITIQEMHDALDKLRSDDEGEGD